MATIGIVEDHPIVRDGIKRLILDSGTARSVSTFNSAEDLLRALSDNERIDLCLLDLHLPGLGGFECLAELQTRWPNLPVIVLTALAPPSVAVRSIKAGAKGFLSKGQDPEELFNAIEKVLHGGRAIHPDVIDHLLQSVGSDEAGLPHERLSNREFDIMMRLARGDSIQSISEDLCISPKTVSTYRRRCLEKMGYQRNSQLTEYVLTQLSPPNSAA